MFRFVRPSASFTTRESRDSFMRLSGGRSPGSSSRQNHLSEHFLMKSRFENDIPEISL